MVFRVSSSGGVILLSVSDTARFFPALQSMCKFGISLELTEICKLYGLDLIFVLKKYNWFMVCK